MGPDTASHPKTESSEESKCGMRMLLFILSGFFFPRQHYNHQIGQFNRFIE